MQKFKNNVIFLLYTVLLGAVVGAIIWGFLRLMGLGIDLIWTTIPAQFNIPFYTLIVCTAGGVLVGLYKKKFGDYPEELEDVMGQVKQTGRYPYNKLPQMLGAAILPLLLGASIGPEAGLTGVIAGLCTWVGDRLKMYFNAVEELTRIGVSATLGTIFRSPMFGFMEPLESDRETVLPKSSKIVLYITAILSSFGTFILLGRFFGGSGGIEGIKGEAIDLVQYLWAIPLTAIGIAAGYLYAIFRKLTRTVNQRLQKYTVLRAMAGGLLLGAMGTVLPLTMFSGEHQIAEITAHGAEIGAWILIVIAIGKLLLTNICIDTGLKGGHFFPVIFAGISLGYGVSLLLHISPLLCMGVVTTALVGHIMKKPVATVLLLMIIFPMRLIPIMLFAAAAARFAVIPKSSEA